MTGRVLRWGAALIVAVVAVGCVLSGWLEAPGPLVAADAVQVTRAAFEHADVEAAVVDEAQPGTYQPATGGGPVEIFRTSADVAGVPVVLYLRRSDGAPVYLDDRSSEGGVQVLSEVQFSRLIAGVDNPGRHDLLVRNLLVTVAAAAILAFAVLSLTLPTEPESR